MGNAKSHIHKEVFQEDQSGITNKEELGNLEGTACGEEKVNTAEEMEGRSSDNVSDQNSDLTEKEKREEEKEELERIEREEERDDDSDSSSDDGIARAMAEEEISLELRPTLEKQDSKHQYDWEQRIIDETLIPNKAIYKAAIVGVDSALKAWSPPDFIPDNQAIQDIIEGFEGDVSGLAERGIAVGCGVRVSVPGKLDKDVALYGNDGHRGGTSAFKTEENIIIIVFEKNPTMAHRLGLRTASFMKNFGR